MKFGVDIRIIADAEGRKGLHIGPHLEGTQTAKNVFVATLVTIAAVASLWMIAESPDPVTHPQSTVTIMGGH
ncbi:hypothetical protein UFOVP418_4 [uncultured Caudovirales phage]|uniref:Uncharacterized protein n=1 Tax=uncultured Caudovirales phage TaxID=2100421 RepID=A0A6J5M779_9CAUD|nr:hypothetical protein UFOVP418_4 [uncultured Caudovirales phage]